MLARVSGRNGRSYFCTGATAIENRKSKIENEESHPSRRRCGDTPFSADEDRLQATSPDLRQANDLLSLGYPHAWRLARGADHFHPEGFADAARLLERWRAPWNSD